MNIEIVRNNLDDSIEIIQFREHSKASEKYIDINIYEDKKIIWSGSIPYFYRRTGIFIESEEELTKYLNEIKINFTKESINKFISEEMRRWETELSGKKTTKSFFDILLNMRWNSIHNSNSNSTQSA